MASANADPNENPRVGEYKQFERELIARKPYLSHPGKPHGPERDELMNKAVDIFGGGDQSKAYEEMLKIENELGDFPGQFGRETLVWLELEIRGKRKKEAGL